MQQVLEKIKNEPFFKWPNKMAGEPRRRNPNLYCQYHRDHGHTTENCRNLWDHLEQLVREGKLKQLLHHSSSRASQAGSEMRGDASSRLPLGTINVIFAALGRNRQAETVNKVIVNGLKKRLDDAKGKWVEELPHVLWTYRTTPRRSTGETPFSMTYGAEAVIPLETEFPTLRTSSFSSDNNDAMLEKSLDLIEERRESTMVQLAYYQHKLKQGYNSNVKLRPLAVGDLVQRKVLGATKNPNWGKLGPNWEGSYRITSIAGIGAYYLEDLDEKAILHPWNVNNLKRYYYY